MLQSADFKRLFDASSHPHMVMARDFTIVEANPAYLRAVGRPRVEVVGHNLFAAFPGRPDASNNEQVVQLRESLERVIRERREDVLALIKYDIPRSAAAGGGFEERYWSATHTPVFAESGAVAYILQQTNDVTELHRLKRMVTEGNLRAEFEVFSRAETVQKLNQALDAERSHLRELFEQAPGFMAVLQGRDHVFEIVNAAYYQLVGHRDIVGRPMAEALEEIGSQGFIELLDEVYDTGKAFVGREMRAFLQREPNAPLEERYVNLVFQPISRADGVVTGIFVQGSDVTERKHAEDALRRMNELLEQRVEYRTDQLLARQAQMQTLYDYSAECHGLVRATPEGDYIYEEANLATLRLYGKARDEVVGHTLQEVLGEKAAAEVSRTFDACISSGRPQSYFGRRNNRIVEATAAPVPIEPGMSPRIFVSARDVTDRREMEEQLRQAQKMEAVGQLTGGIAHDFNNLLTVVIGNIDRLAREVQDERPKRLASMALTGARKAAMLTHRLLAFSRKQPLDPRPIHIDRLIVDMSDILARALGETIFVASLLPAGLWMTSADQNQVENALLNLALNARDAMPRGGKLTIETANVSVPEGESGPMAAGEYVLLSVQDTGNGMPPDVLERAFEPFFTTKEAGEGSGLGLSMVYGFMKQSGGHVQIESALGKGTTVRLYFPRFIALAAVEEPSPQLAPPRIVDGKTILVVEDSEQVREYAVSALRDLGYDVIAASNAAQAMQLLRSKQSIDLLFTDIVLPGDVNGRELADLACRRRPELKILFTTGYAADALPPGETRLINKPFTVNEVATRIAAAFSD